MNVSGEMIALGVFSLKRKPVMLFKRDGKIINSDLLNLPDRSKDLALSVTQVICCMKERDFCTQ